jgi:hypothetical protein
LKSYICNFLFLPAHLLSFPRVQDRRVRLLHTSTADPDRPTTSYTAATRADPGYPPLLRVYTRSATVRPRHPTRDAGAGGISVGSFLDREWRARGAGGTARRTRENPHGVLCRTHGGSTRGHRRQPRPRRLLHRHHLEKFTENPLFGP